MAHNLPPPASRYAGLAVGPRLGVAYEVQDGVPVDGTNESLRRYSPFSIAIVPPDLSGTSSTGSSNVLSFSTAAASTGSNNASGTAVGLLVAGQATSYTATSLREAASVPRPPGLNLPPESVMSDIYTAADIRLQQEALNRIAQDPLTLLVNPIEMNTTYDRIHSFQARSRYGYVYQVWGEQLVKISFTGSTAGFVAGSSKGYQALVDKDTGSASGYQWASRRNSAAWQNFSALVQFYRNNGYIYDTLGKSEAHLMIGSVRITYDDIVYEGHIDTFNYSFDENSPHRVQFDMEFMATRIVDVTRASGVVVPMKAATAGPNGRVDTPEEAIAAVGAIAIGTATNRASRRIETASTPMGD